MLLQDERIKEDRHAGQGQGLTSLMKGSKKTVMQAKAKA